MALALANAIYNAGASSSSEAGSSLKLVLIPTGADGRAGGTGAAPGLELVIDPALELALEVEEEDSLT